jgi:hypothetical protein
LAGTSSINAASRNLNRNQRELLIEQAVSVNDRLNASQFA